MVAWDRVARRLIYLPPEAGNLVEFIQYWGEAKVRRKARNEWREEKAAWVAPMFDEIDAMAILATGHL